MLLIWAQASPPIVEPTLNVVIKGFAIVGAAVLGGLAIGLFVQLLVRLFSGQRLPKVPLTLVRLLGGVTCGLLAGWWLFGPGGSGFGFPGGGGSGSGTGTLGAVSGKDTPAKDDTVKHPGSVPSEGPPSIEVEILGGSDPKRYRIRDKDGFKKLTLAEVEKLVAERKDSLKEVVLVVYENETPDADYRLARDRMHQLAKDLAGTRKERIQVVERRSEARLLP